MNLHVLGTGMPEDIVERFLGDVIKFLLDGKRQPFRVWRAFHLQFGLYAPPPLHRFQSGLQSSDQSGLFQRQRTQLKNEQPHLAQRLLRRIPQFAQVIRSFQILPIRQQDSGSFSEKGYTVESLSYRVMQLARQAIALGDYRSLFGLFVQPRVFHGDTDLLTDGG